MSIWLESFQNMPKEPQLWYQEEIIADNKAFQAENDAATPQWTQELKRSVMETLYGVNSSDIQEEPKIIEDEKQLDNNKELEKFKDHPDYPILSRFLNIEVSEWKKLDLLTESDLLQLSQHLWSTDDIIWDVRRAIHVIDFDDERAFDILNNYLNKIESINPPLEQDTSWIYKLPEDFNSYMVLYENADNDIIQLLIKNYTKLPDWINWESNVENDIFTACEITLNKIIEWKKFRKTETYYDAIEDARNWDLDLRIEALKYINSLVNTSEWMKWWKAKSNFNKIKTEHSITKKMYIEFKIHQLEEQMNNTQDSKEQQKLKVEFNQLLIELEKEDYFEWEVISWWELDVQTEWEDWVVLESSNWINKKEEN